MSAKVDKIAAVAKEAGLDVATLTQFLHEELDPIKSQILMRGIKAEAINRSLTANGEGVFYSIISSGKLPSEVGYGVSDYVGTIRAGIRERATEKQHFTCYGTTNIHIADEEFYYKVLSKHKNAGVISIIPQGVETLASVCTDLKMPCVLMDYVDDVPKDGIHTLNVDNRQGSYNAVKHLIDLGHRRIAYLSGMLEFHSAQARLDGYRDALSDANIPYDESLVQEGTWIETSGEAFIKKLLVMDTPPTALVAANDLMAMGALIEAKIQGLNLPKDLSIIGCDDIPMIRTITPALTTLRQPMKEMGAKATDIIIDALEGKTFDTQDHKMPLELVVRNSTSRA